MKITSTFSVAGRCAATGALGAVVTSSSPSVGARCPWVKSNVGVILTQNVTDPRLAAIGLSAMEKGYNAQAAIRTMMAASDFPEFRQLAVVDAKGGSSVFTGEKALGVHGEFYAEDVASIGNLLSDPSIPIAMGQRFMDRKDLPLPERLISAIELGFNMGGELDDEHSIALLVYHPDAPFAYVDLRVDYSEDPLQDLKKLWEIYSPQAMDYKIRAIEPERAPSYGVKGDE
ncbi:MULTISPECIES: DUF1028 domain-containing protein [Bacillaceae]|uniref:DUF1028 domain-containing protein n=1 Tax=Bacillaceae TaxID=186817 RepID=UPI000596BF14|nr:MULTISPECIES: DUF1028 domain-containing protein [Bacillus]KIL74017.1 hypothetical protein SD78_3075 [Bacillus badius]RJS61839.1 DUF1028 domain-containing protein [Bacillus sp. PK3_68]UAT32827.1 DUF1028 domain-containing protein [Bacillus badius]GLY11878.1 hypothetical protein Bbad01_30940 [Bacillus badius]